MPSEPDKPEAASEPVAAVESQSAIESQPAVESQPAASPAVEAVEPERSSHSRRITQAVQGAVSGGVEALGAGVEKLGEGVTKLGEVVPLVGAGVSKIGEGIAKAGESIHVLPRVAQTRRGRLLVRSTIVGFLLVASWIAAIVMLQLRGNDTPDFRPAAERILVELGKGPDAIGKVYDAASPRFHELWRREQFVDLFTDMNATLGKFREIIAINDTLVTTGPTGTIGRVSLTASYDQGICTGSVSFHYDRGRWKLLGVGIEVPTDLPITQAQREQRVAACKDPNDWKNPKSPTYCDARAAAEAALASIRDGRAGDVWDAGTPVFKQQTTRDRFIALQNEHRAALGAYRRIISVTEAKQFTTSGGGWSATFDVLAEFERSSGVRVVFGFYRSERTKPWMLASFKVVLPMPRADDEARADGSDAPPPP